jgi:hypothetical protein
VGCDVRGELNAVSGLSFHFRMSGTSHGLLRQGFSGLPELPDETNKGRPFPSCCFFSHVAAALKVRIPWHRTWLIHPLFICICSLTKHPSASDISG